MKDTLATVIHPTAVVDQSAQLGQGVRIEAYAIVEPDTEIGDHTHIGYHAVIHAGARNAEQCKISVGACIAGLPQDLKYKGEYTQTHIGARTSLREFVTVNRGTAASGETSIGTDCLIMAYGHVAHDCRLGHHCVISNTTNLAGHVELGNHVRLSAHIGIQQFVRIGSYAMVAHASTVIKDIPPYALVAKYPLRFMGPNLVGLQRNGMDAHTIKEIKDIYQLIYHKGHNRSAALAMVADQFPASVHREEIISFIENSEYGIIG